MKSPGPVRTEELELHSGHKARGGFPSWPGPGQIPTSHGSPEAPLAFDCCEAPEVTLGLPLTGLHPSVPGDGVFPQPRPRCRGRFPQPHPGPRWGSRPSGRRRAFPKLSPYSVDGHSRPELPSVKDEGRYKVMGCKPLRYATQKGTG